MPFDPLAFMTYGQLSKPTTSGTGHDIKVIIDTVNTTVKSG